MSRGLGLRVSEADPSAMGVVWNTVFEVSNGHDRIMFDCIFAMARPFGQRMFRAFAFFLIVLITV